jgi:uncharacterized protein YdbL (DUF1318 family)
MSYRHSFAAAVVVVMLGAGMGMTAGPAVAQTSEQKALIDTAKTQGTVGEQADGYLGFRTATSDQALHAAVEAVNTGRRQVYAQSAAQAGTTADVAGARMFESQLLPRIPVGQWYRNAQGQWVQR